MRASSQSQASQQPVFNNEEHLCKENTKSVSQKTIRKRIGIFVIAYNAESHIGETLSRIPADIWDVIDIVYVIDDCSTDDTVERALSFPEHRDKLVILRNRVNRMYGGNQKLGYQYAIDQNLDAVVMLHADGQYAPECLEKMIGPIINGDCDVVIGSRMLRWVDARRGRMPLYKLVGNIILTKLQNMLSGMNLSEFHSGYRAYSTQFLRKLPLWEYTDSWHFDTQILLAAQCSGAKLQEIAIPTYYGNEICRVNGISYAIHCLWTTLQYCMFRKKIMYSRAFDVGQVGAQYPSKFHDPFSSHSKIIKRLNQESIVGKTVLELGVGDASMVERMTAMGATVDAVEHNEASCDAAERVCRRVYRHDLEAIDQLQIAESYDVVILADVLEHLRNPEHLLSKAKTILKTGGLLVVSLPNVANIYVRINLLLGRFPYHSKGILDRSHLRFYTLKTAEQLLSKTGWVIEQKDVTTIPLTIVFPFLMKGPWSVLLSCLHGITKAWKGLYAYQGLFYCRNANSPRLL